MAIQLTPEQERRVQAVISSGAYTSVNDVMEAALASLEQRAAQCFDGTEQELEALLLEGLASKEHTEKEFWESVNRRTSAILDEETAGSRP